MYRNTSIFDRGCWNLCDFKKKINQLGKYMKKARKGHPQELRTGPCPTSPGSWGSAVPGTLPPSCPGTPDQPRCAGRVRRVGLAHKAWRRCSTRTQQGWDGAISGLQQSMDTKSSQQGHIRNCVPWTGQCTSLSQKARHITYPARQQGCSWTPFSCPTGYTLEVNSFRN